MNMVRIFVISSICGLLLLSGCEGTAPQKKTAAVGGPFLVSQNLVGEKCLVEAAVEEDVLPLVEEGYQIFCGRWEHATARVYRVASEEGDLASWNRSDNWWRQIVDQRATCEAPLTEAFLGDHDALLLECRLKNGGWPFSAVIAQVNDSVYLGDGIPAALPVIEETIGILAGAISPRENRIDRRTGARINKWRSKISSEVYGANDLDNYYRYMIAGQYYDSVHQFAEAESRYRKALLLQEQLMGVDNPKILDPMMHLALELSNQERFDEADVLFNRVESGMVRSSDAVAKTRYTSYRAIHQANQRHYDEALDLARVATVERLNLFQAPAAGAADERVLGEVAAQRVSKAELAQGYYLEAAMLQRVGEVSEANDALSEAQASVATETRIPPTWRPRMMQLEAELVSDLDDSKGLISKLQGARDLLVQAIPEERPTALANIDLGQRYFKSGQLDQALDSFRAGIKLVKQQNGYLSLIQASPFFDLVLAITARDPEVEQALYREAFDAAQLIRNKRTETEIARASARLAVGDSSVASAIRALQDTQDRRSILFQEYDAELASVHEEQEKSRLEELRQQIYKAEQEIKDLGKVAQAANPLYYQMVGTPTSSSEFVKTLLPGEALMQVLLGDDHSYLLFLKNGRFQIHTLKLTRERAEQYVEKLREGLTIKQTAGKPYVPHFDVSTAHELYRHLFGPIEGELTAVNHLVAVPSGPLSSLPFGILVTEKASSTNRRDYTETSWLIKRLALSVIPSARSLVDLRATASSSNATKDFIGFADFVPVSAADVSQIKPNLSEECIAVPERINTFRRDIVGFSPLPGTREQVEAIAENYPPEKARLVLGSQFNDQSLTTNPLLSQLSDYRIVHFATHGFLPAEINCTSEPALATSYSGQAENSDSLLDLSDINNLQLDAELVVLSACNTGVTGRSQEGEALSGLAKAFFYAGARSLIVSHWTVVERATTKLMIDTFNSSRGQEDFIGWSAALRLAQLEAINVAKREEKRQLAHPFFWGAFMVVGDGARTDARLTDDIAKK